MSRQFEFLTHTPPKEVLEPIAMDRNRKAPFRNPMIVTRCPEELKFSEVNCLAYGFEQLEAGEYQFTKYEIAKSLDKLSHPKIIEKALQKLRSFGYIVAEEEVHSPGEVRYVKPTIVYTLTPLGLLRYLDGTCNTKSKTVQSRLNNAGNRQDF